MLVGYKSSSTYYSPRRQRPFAECLAFLFMSFVALWVFVWICPIVSKLPSAKSHKSSHGSLVRQILSVTIGLKLKRIVATTDYMLADRFGRIELMSRHRSHLPMDFQSVASCLNYIGNFMKSPQVMVIFLFFCTTNRPPLEADSKICDCLF